MDKRRSTGVTVATIIVILVLFLGGALALLWPQFNQKPQQGLTLKATATVIDRQLRPRTGMPARDYTLTYTYVADGHSYRSSTISIDGEISGDSFTVCVDPAHPELNAPLVAGAKCGDAGLGKWTGTAERVG